MNQLELMEQVSQEADNNNHIKGLQDYINQQKQTVLQQAQRLEQTPEYDQQTHRIESLMGEIKLLYNAHQQIQNYTQIKRQPQWK